MEDGATAAGLRRSLMSRAFFTSFSWSSGRCCAGGGAENEKGQTPGLSDRSASIAGQRRARSTRHEVSFCGAGQQQVRADRHDAGKLPAHPAVRKKPISLCMRFSPLVGGMRGRVADARTVATSRGALRIRARAACAASLRSCATGPSDEQRHAGSRRRPLQGLGRDQPSRDARRATRRAGRSRRDRVRYVLTRRADRTTASGGALSDAMADDGQRPVVAHVKHAGRPVDPASGKPLGVVSLSGRPHR